MLRRSLAELIGTFVLVFGGVGNAALAGSKVGHLGIGLAFGLTLLTMAYAIGPISACHINPAVTVGFLTVGKISGRDAAGYIAGRVLGTIPPSGRCAGRPALPGAVQRGSLGPGRNLGGGHRIDIGKDIATPPEPRAGDTGRVLLLSPTLPERTTG